MKGSQLSNLKSQRGAAVMIMVLGLSVIVGVIVYVANSYVENTLAKVSLQRDRIAALQVLQDFALLAGKANEVFESNLPAPGCPGTHQRYPAAPARFCWIAGQTCVKNPIGMNSNICLTIPTAAASGGQVLHVAKKDLTPAIEAMPEETTRWQRMIAYFRDIKTFRREIVNVAHRDLMGMVSGEAYAARPEMHLPGVGAPDPVGPSQNTINNRACGPGTPNDYCKVCGNNVQCLELRVCVAAPGCRNVASPAPTFYKDWYRQRIGVIAR